jgi:hypothetical protein
MSPGAPDGHRYRLVQVGRRSHHGAANELLHSMEGPSFGASVVTSLPGPRRPPVSGPGAVS